MITGDPSGATSDAEFTFLFADRGFRVDSGGNFTNIVTVTVQSQLYLVTYTWAMLAKTWDSDQRGAKMAEKTQQVNAICAHPHVQEFRTESDQDRSKVLFHYAVIGVGTEDESIIDDVTWRMDSIYQSGVFTAIDNVWNELAKVGAV